MILDDENDEIIAKNKNHMMRLNLKSYLLSASILILFDTSKMTQTHYKNQSVETILVIQGHTSDEGLNPPFAIRR